MGRYLYLSVFTLVLLLCLKAEKGNCAQAAGGVARDEGSRFKISRSISGSKGSQQLGRFVVEDPRAVFSIPQDRQVIVYFELEGPLGMHRLEGFWKNPSGKVVTISDFNYESRERRFSAYWTLALSESAETGTWMLEARVDGEYVGAFSFQILANAPSAAITPKKKIIGPSEAYERLQASTFFVQKIGKDGSLLGTCAGFFMNPSTFVSAFRAVDGASRVRVIFPNGRVQETDQMLDWNRHQGWAAIKIDANQTPVLPLAENGSWEVGVPVSYLDVEAAGNRVLSEVRIIGKNTFQLSGDRLNLSAPASDRAVGSPIVNEYGEVVGMLAGNPVDSAPAEPMRVGGATAITIGNIRPKQAATAAMESLIQNGESIPPVLFGRYVLFAQLTHKIDNAWPVDSATQFSRRDNRMAVFVMWQAKEEVQGKASIRLYNRENQSMPIAKIKDVKVNLKPGKKIQNYWQLDPSNLAAGVYHVDILFNGEPASRAYFQIMN